MSLCKNQPEISQNDCCEDAWVRVPRAAEWSAFHAGGVARAQGETRDWSAFHVLNGSSGAGGEFAIGRAAMRKSCLRQIYRLVGVPCFDGFLGLSGKSRDWWAFHILGDCLVPAENSRLVGLPCFDWFFGPMGEIRDWSRNHVKNVFA